MRVVHATALIVAALINGFSGALGAQKMPPPPTGLGYYTYQCPALWNGPVRVRSDEGNLYYFDGVSFWAVGTTTPAAGIPAIFWIEPNGVQSNSTGPDGRYRKLYNGVAQYVCWERMTISSTGIVKPQHYDQLIDVEGELVAVAEEGSSCDNAQWVDDPYDEPGDEWEESWSEPTCGSSVGESLGGNESVSSMDGLHCHTEYIYLDVDYGDGVWVTVWEGYANVCE
jgi:hypothetical protein